MKNAYEQPEAASETWRAPATRRKTLVPVLPPAQLPDHMTRKDIRRAVRELDMERQNGKI